MFWGRGVALGMVLRGFRRDARFPWSLSVEEAKTRAFTSLHNRVKVGDFGGGNPKLARSAASN